MYKAVPFGSVTDQFGSLSPWLCVSVFAFVGFFSFPFSWSASVKTANVWIGGELNCLVWAPSRLSSPWDNEMTINGKAVAVRSFVRMEVEQQLGRKDREHWCQDRSWRELNSCFNSTYSGLLDVNNLWKLGDDWINRSVKNILCNGPELVDESMANNEHL